jgi:hypothetical protein
MDVDSQDYREGVLRWLFDIIFVEQAAAGHIIEIPGNNYDHGGQHLAPFRWVNRDCPKEVG